MPCGGQGSQVLGYRLLPPRYNSREWNGELSIGKTLTGILTSDTYSQVMASPAVSRF